MKAKIYLAVVALLAAGSAAVALQARAQEESQQSEPEPEPSLSLGDIDPEILPALPELTTSTAEASELERDRSVEGGAVGTGEDVSASVRALQSSYGMSLEAARRSMQMQSAYYAVVDDIEEGVLNRADHGGVWFEHSAAGSRIVFGSTTDEGVEVATRLAGSLNLEHDARLVQFTQSELEAQHDKIIQALVSEFDQEQLTEQFGGIDITLSVQDNVVVVSGPESQIAKLRAAIGDTLDHPAVVVREE